MIKPQSSQRPFFTPRTPRSQRLYFSNEKMFSWGLLDLLEISRVHYEQSDAVLIWIRRPHRIFE